MGKKTLVQQFSSLEGSLGVESRLAKSDGCISIPKYIIK
jgi:hypothetical protein